MHWTEKMFLEHGELFLKLLKRAEIRVLKEVEGLERIFSEMGIRAGDRVLDLCCGHGRHALRLTEKGFVVTGIDISPIAIEHAKELAENMKVRGRVEFLVGDARNVLKLLEKNKGDFGAVISMWTSLGYYDDKTDRGILKQLNSLVSSRGILIIEIANRDFLVKNFQPFGIIDLEDCELHEHRILNLEKSRMDLVWKFYHKKGDELKHLTSIPLNHRLYSLHELIALLETTGWEYINSYGTWDLQPVTQDTFMIRIVGRKLN
jgi:SAM-dependent methyltransferase